MFLQGAFIALSGAIVISSALIYHALTMICAAEMAGTIGIAILCARSFPAGCIEFYMLGAAGKIICKDYPASC